MNKQTALKNPDTPSVDPDFLKLEAVGVRHYGAVPDTIYSSLEPIHLRLRKELIPYLF
ncbi:hypothetical protein RCG24_17030 [Neobacillus sp. OS1-32]|uniref:hypothetical protein n=1 Tax=Neobacillus sp. OS1-32 TaxID=3070682 RepID=UPI0027E1D0C2|nr:hypothetical protein [Neobacillus sp. OS1-32]WML29605.1 hypothetical protein RCG24_17030 [Neobacillus sp. OS1-32]